MPLQKMFDIKELSQSFRPNIRVQYLDHFKKDSWVSFLKLHDSI